MSFIDNDSLNGNSEETFQHEYSLSSTPIQDSDKSSTQIYFVVKNSFKIIIFIQDYQSFDNTSPIYITDDEAISLLNKTENDYQEKEFIRESNYECLLIY